MLDIKRKFTIWKPNASRLSYGLVLYDVVVLISSKTAGRDKKATEVQVVPDKKVSTETFSSDLLITLTNSYFNLFGLSRSVSFV